MTKNQNSKQYDLEERTLEFAKELIAFVKTLPKTIANTEIAKQVIRSSGSVGANYIEANELVRYWKNPNEFRNLNLDIGICL